MALTRKLLKDMQLEDEKIEQIIAAHVATIEALKAERDAALTENEELHAQVEQLSTASQSAAEVQAAFDAYRTQIETEKRLTARQQALTAALTEAGANPQALPLLLDAITLPEEAWQDNALTNPAEALYPWRTKYAALFQVKSPLPVTRVAPPIHSGGLLTPADVKRMSAEDINRHWNAVKSALQR